MLRLAAVEPRWRPRSNEPVRDHERRLVEAEAGVAAEGDPTVYKPMYDSLYVPLHGNVASLERVLRVLVGMVFLALAIVGPRSIWGLLGVVPMITGAIGYCPFYAMLSSLSHTSRHGHSH